MRKKLLSLLLAAVLVIGMVPAFAFGAAYTVVIEPKYEYAGQFSEGLLAVQLNGKWGYIDKTGKEIIPINLQYDKTWNFYDGRAAVELNGKWGCIDKTGKVVIPLKYDAMYEFSDGLAIVRLNGKWGAIDTNGNEIVPIKYDDARMFSDGLLPVMLGEKWGYVDRTGKEVISFKYILVGYFCDGLAWVGLHDESGWSYIDKTGKTVLDGDKYGQMYTFSEGLTFVTKSYERYNIAEGGGSWFIIDKTGKETKLEGFENSTSSIIYSFGQFTEGLAWVKKYNADIYDEGKYGYVDKTGKIVIPFKYDNAGDFNEGYTWANIGGKEGIIDKAGNEIVPMIYDNVRPVESGMTAFELNGKWGIISVGTSAPAPAPTPTPTPAPNPSVTANPTASTVYVDGEIVAFDAYNINDENYFKLRDVAYVLNGTRVQFDAAWDGAANMISLTSGKAYTPDGSEMKAKGTEKKTAILNKAKIMLNGKEVELTAYNIDGNNYFKMRELAITFDFSVGYDGTITVDTANSYTAP